jgi:predicted type IV restriction endonuclease
MDLIDKLKELAARMPKQLEYIQTEEATKNAFVMPFISSLGYDVFDPTEVTPELNADIGLKKGEKVDYAILKDGKPIVLFECKHHAADLAKEHASQLYRYFSVTEARFGVLTNGIVYWFYSDLEASNKMDSKPFFEFNMLDIREQDVEELKKFTKSVFDINGILTSAGELKFTREIKRIMAEQLQNPSDEFVKFFSTQVYPGRMSGFVKEQFTQATKRALRLFISEQINERLKTALAGDAGSIQVEPTSPIPPATEISNGTNSVPNIVTTPEEQEAFIIIKALLRDSILVNRIALRDQQSYCGILLDDNNRKPICRLYFTERQKQIGFFDNEQRKETKTLILGLDDIYQFGDRLKTTVNYYVSK